MTAAGVIYGVFVGLSDRPAYVGQTRDFRARVNGHRAAAASRSDHPLYVLMRDAPCRFVPLASCLSPDVMDWCEGILIEQWGTMTADGGCNKQQIGDARWPRPRFLHTHKTKSWEEIIVEIAQNGPLGYEAMMNVTFSRSGKSLHARFPRLFPSATEKPFPDVDEVAERARFEARWA